MKEGTAITVTKTEQQKIKADLYAQVSYDIVGEIEAITNLKRSTLVEILKSIKSDKFYMLRQNPEEFIAWIGKYGQRKAIENTLMQNGFVIYEGSEEYKKVVSDDLSWFVDEKYNEVILRPNHAGLVIGVSRGALPIIADIAFVVASLKKLKITSPHNKYNGKFSISNLNRFEKTMDKTVIIRSGFSSVHKTPSMERRYFTFTSLETSSFKNGLNLTKF